MMNKPLNDHCVIVATQQDSHATATPPAHIPWADHQDSHAESLTDDPQRIALIAMARAGNQCALNTLYEQHEALARRVAATYKRPQVDMNDLFQEAYIGIVLAIRTFNATHRVPFSRYAAYWMRHCCGRYIAKQGHSITLPEEVFLAHRKVSRCIQSIEQARLPINNQTLHAYGCTTTDIARAIYYQPAPASFDSLRYEVSDVVPTPTIPSNDDNRDILTDALATLPQREYYVISHLYGLEDSEQTITMLATAMNVTRQRIQQIHHDAIAHLRVAL